MKILCDIFWYFFLYAHSNGKYSKFDLFIVKEL